MTTADPYAASDHAAYGSRPFADYAVLGVGSMAAAVVAGLCDGIVDAPRIVLSPRSVNRSSELAAKYTSVTVARDNQDLIDSARVVVLCVRPQDARSVLSELHFRSDHVVISAMAAVSLASLAALVEPASSLSRVVPQVSVADRASVTPGYPAVPAAAELFERLGGFAVVPSEQSLDDVSVASATVAAFLAYAGRIASWLEARGLGDEFSARHVASLFAALSDELTEIRSTEGLSAMAAAHATRGGLNERLAMALDAAGVYAAVGEGLDRLRDDLPRC